MLQSLATHVPSWSVLAPKQRQFFLFIWGGYILCAYSLSPENYRYIFQSYLSHVFLFSVITTAIIPVMIDFYTPKRNLTNIPLAGLSLAQAMIIGLKKRFVTAVLVAIAFASILASFTTIKNEIPNLIPFYADPFFAELDIALHGDETWRIAHRLAGNIPGYDASIGLFYTTIWGIHWPALFIVAVCFDRENRRDRYLWSFMLSLIICGTILAILLSSGGPIFYNRLVDDTLYTDLIPALEAHNLHHSVLGPAAYLYHNYIHGTTEYGSGISAMPSVHVAMVTLNAWYLTERHRKTGLIFWAYAIFIMFGSVYTGWHYALDAYLSFVVVTLIWFGVKYLLPDPPLQTGKAQDTIPI